MPICFDPIGTLLAYELGMASVVESCSKPSILLIDDDRQFTELVVQYLSQDYLIAIALDASEAMRSLSSHPPDLLLLDYGLPSMTGLDFLKIVKRRYPNVPVVMLTGRSNPETIIETMREGASDYVIKGSEDFTTTLKFRIGQTLDRAAILKKNERLSAKLNEQAKGFEIIGNSPSILKLKSDLLKLKGTNASVLITGENGTGKDLIARNLNLQEEDASRPFVAINCAGIPSTLFESELFGHVKGAFTGAIDNKIGQFKLADGGDIFLDEIAEIPPELQAKLLRVLQQKTFTPVGGIKPISVDVRIISATNRSIDEEIRKGRFREDLFYRLNGIRLNVPSLRERPEDILVLAEAFLKRSRPLGTFSEGAKKAIVAHPWRGNIRELEHAVERAAIMMKNSSKPVVMKEDLGLDSSSLPTESALLLPKHMLPDAASDISPEQFQAAMDWMERQYFLRGLKVLRGGNRAFYNLLDISKAHFFRRKKELGLTQDIELTSESST